MISDSLDFSSPKRSGKSKEYRYAKQNAIAAANRMATGPVATDGTLQFMTPEEGGEPR